MNTIVKHVTFYLVASLLFILSSCTENENIVTPQKDASLSSIELSRGTLSPSFNSSILDYDIQVDVSTIRITPTASDNNSTITINGSMVESGNASNPISLGNGENTITINVTAEDGTTEKTYTVNATRCYFFEDFPGKMNHSWTFEHAKISIVDEKLSIKTDNDNYYSIANCEFPSSVIPEWRIECEASFITSTPNAFLEFGPYIRIEGSAGQDIEMTSMRLTLIKNPISSYCNGANWIWTWFDKTFGWGPWNNSCYGLSSAIKTNGEINNVEMICHADKSFTIKVNGATLTNHNNALLECQAQWGISLSLAVTAIGCWGPSGLANIETSWDNVIFTTQSEKSMDDYDLTKMVSKNLTPVFEAKGTNTENFIVKKLLK